LTDFSISPDRSKSQIPPRFWLLVALAALCLANRALAIDPHRPFSQYIRDQWSAGNGFPGGKVNAFAQTADGYLWIGTPEGLFRFDGTTFVSAQQLDPSFRSITNVLGLTTDSEGNLWVWMQGLILRYCKGRFEDVTTDLAPGSFITAMAGSFDGGVLLSNPKRGEILYGKGKDGFKSLASSETFLTALVIAIAQTPDGKIWIGTRGDGLFCLANGQITSITQGLPDRKINSLLAAKDGKLWIGTDSGIALWDGSSISTNHVPPSLSRTPISALLRDRDANVWVGTPLGLVRLNSENVALLQPTRKKGPAEITALFEDREGNVWIGTSHGIERLRDSAFVTYSSSEEMGSEDMPSESNSPIYVDSDERVWFGPSNGGLSWMRGDKVTAVSTAGRDSDVTYSIAGAGDDLWAGMRQGGLKHFTLRQGSVEAFTYTRANGLAQNSVYVVHENRDGTVWAGTLSGGVSELKDGRFITYTTADGLASNSMTAIEEGSDGTMWFGTRGGLTALSHGQFHTYTTHDGLPSDDIISLLQGADDTLWIGTAGGLASFSSNKIRDASTLADSLRGPIEGLAEDRKGSLWIAIATATPDHVIRANQSKLVNGDLQEGDLQEYGPADGLHGTAGVRRSRSVVTDQLGRIWFSLNHGIAVVDPERLRNSLPVTPSIEAVVADGVARALTDPVHIPGPSHRIAFNYAGVSLSVPERIRYRYMLEGFDHGWSDSTTARQAIYTNLAPGAYRFRAISSNSDGLWNGSEAAVSIKIDPVFWQAWWFQLSCGLTSVIVIWMVYQTRVRQVFRQMQARLEERLEERERIARDLHDTLLQGIYSASIHLDLANSRLQEDSPAKPAVERGLELIRQVSQEGRNALRSLRSRQTSSEGLEQALSLLSKEFALPENIDFVVASDGQTRALRPLVRDEAYLIAREAVINAIHHAQASKIEVEVSYSSRHLRIMVRDNGCGIDSQLVRTGREGHWGLQGMRERSERIGGRLNVLSGVDAGTEIELSVPGALAFQDGSAGRFWSWLPRLYPRKRRSKAQKASEGQPK
jgi:ligand-binding sensor domain-containing protein/signal transduction histidine kinase